MTKQIQLREFKKEKTLEEILLAAEYLFVQNGFDKTSIDDIAQRAVVSRKTVYNYIALKEDIIVKIANKRLNTWLQNTLNHTNWNSNPEQKIVYIFRNLAKEFKKEKKLWKEIIQADGLNYLRHFSQRPIMRSIIKCFKEIIGDGQRSGQFVEKFNPDMLAWHLVSIQTNLCMEWAMGWPDSHSLAKRLQASLDLFFSGLANIR